MPIDHSTGSYKSFLPYWLWIFFILLLILITQLLPFNGLYGQDGHEYLRYSLYIEDLFAGKQGDSPFFYPIGYPMFGALLGYVFENIFALQLISMLSLVVSAFCLLKILVNIYPAEKKNIFFFVSLFFVLSPFILRASLVVMSDLFALMWFMLAMWQCLRYWGKPGLQDLIGFGLAASFSIITRYAAAVILLLPLLCLIYKMVSDRKYVHLPLLSLLLFAGPVLQFYIKGIDPYGLLDHPLILEWKLENIFNREFQSHEGFLKYSFINLVYPLYTFIHPGFFALFLPLLFFIKRRDVTRPMGLWMMGIFVLYAIFLAGIPFQNNRFLLLVFPIVLPLFYPAFHRLSQWIKDKTDLIWPIVVGIIVLLQLTLSVRAIYPFWQMNQLERKVAHTVNELDRDKKLYTFGLDVALRTYDVNLRMVNLRNDHVRTAQAGDYLLFNEEKFKTQWEGSSIMKHYHSLKNKFQLVEKQTFSDNWTLYELR